VITKGLVALVILFTVLAVFSPIIFQVFQMTGILPITTPQQLESKINAFGLICCAGAGIGTVLAMFCDTFMCT